MSQDQHTPEQGSGKPLYASESASGPRVGVSRRSNPLSGPQPGTEGFEGAAFAAHDCEHHYETRILGGHPLHVRACTLCRTPDWIDLYEQADTLFRWGREEGLAGKLPRVRLSAYDMPRQEPTEPAATPAPADTLRQRLAVDVECAIGLNVGNGESGAVEAATQAVLAVVQPELDRLAALLDAESRTLAEVDERCDRYAAAIERVRALHQPMQRGPFTICAQCSGWDGEWRCRGLITEYPCPTLAALQPPAPAHDGPTVAEAAADDRKWPLEKHGE